MVNIKNAVRDRNAGKELAKFKCIRADFFHIPRDRNAGEAICTKCIFANTCYSTWNHSIVTAKNQRVRFRFNERIAVIPAVVCRISSRNSDAFHKTSPKCFIPYTGYTRRNYNTVKIGVEKSVFSNACYAVWKRDI